MVGIARIRFNGPADTHPYIISIQHLALTRCALFAVATAVFQGRTKGKRAEKEKAADATYSGG